MNALKLAQNIMSELMDKGLPRVLKLPNRQSLKFGLKMKPIARDLYVQKMRHSHEVMSNKAVSFRFRSDNKVFLFFIENCPPKRVKIINALYLEKISHA